MAQHDYIISNQTFPNTRADINNLASAIATNNSGTSAPSPQYAGQFWIDTTSSTWTLYIHDGTDDIQFATIDTSANTVNFIDSALDVVTDTTPQLGGDLDLNSNDITGTGNINITGNITASGNLAGTLTTASQPNITSVGTLTSLDVGGTITSDGLTVVDGPSGQINIHSSSYNIQGGTFYGDMRFNAPRFRFFEDGTTLRMNIDNGDISFYEDTGTTPKFFWDSSNEGISLGSSQLQGDWGTIFPALEIASRGALWATSSGWSSVPATNLGNNVSRNNSGTFKYIESDPACFLSLDSNKFRFYQASTGTAGNTISFTEAMHIDSSGNVGIGTSSIDYNSAGRTVVHIEGSAGALLALEDTGARGYLYQAGNDLLIENDNATGSIIFGTNASTERMRIDSSGNVLVGKTSSSVNNEGVTLFANGDGGFTRSADVPLYLNRKSNDGTLISFNQDNNQEGTISVSGTTVSYNGGHLSRWSQLTTNTRDESIVKGTVMSNLDEMCVWGDEDNEQLNKMKVSDIEGDDNVAGVFVNWDNDDDVYTNDMNIAMTGDMVIRIAQGVPVHKGQLLMSAGDGTAKPQGDDIVRSKTIAKVTSNNVTKTYDDGSYLVPCVLMAC